MTDTAPGISKIIIDSLFDKNFRVSVFFFIIGILVLEIIYLSYCKKHGGITGRTALIILAVSTIIGGMLLVSDRNDKYDAPYMFTFQGGKCLAETYTEIFDEYEDEFDGTQSAKYLDEMKYVHETSDRDETFAPIAHFVIDMYIFAIGYMLLLLVFESADKAAARRPLVAFMAFPTGAAMVCTVGMVFILAGIPFRRAAIAAAGILMIAMLIVLVIRAKKSWQVSVSSLIKTFAIASGIFVVLIWGKTAWFSPDSVEKTMYGMMLAEYDLTRTDIFTFSAYGFLEPIVHAVAWKWGVDFLYSFYPAMAICSLGIIATTATIAKPDIKEPVSDAAKLFAILAAGVSIIFLATNYEFATLGIWVLSNGAVGTYLLIIMVFILLLTDKNPCRSRAIALPLLLIFFTLLVTRVEGGCYIALFLILALGIKSFRERYLYISLAAAAEMIIWNVLQLCFFSGVNAQYWNPTNGIIVIAGAAVLAILAVVSRIRVRAIEWIMRYFYPISLIVLMIAAIVCISCTGEFGTKTLYIFMHHFASSDYNNSAAFWSYLLLMLPLMIAGRKKKNSLSISIVGCYLLMTLIILCFRADNISHLGIGDSGRRLIAQIMPAAMLAASTGGDYEL